MNDDLSKVLKAWNPGAASPDAVRGGVWQRIERQQARPWNQFIDNLLSLLSRPAWACTVVALALLAGVTLGSVVSENSQAEAYLVSVTPFVIQP